MPLNTTYSPFLLVGILFTCPTQADIVKIITCHNPTGPRIDYIKEHSNEQLSKWPPEVTTDGYKDTHPTFVFELEGEKYKGTYTWENSSTVKNIAKKANVVLNNPTAKKLVVTEYSEKRIVGILFADTATALFTFFPEAEKGVFTWHSADIVPEGSMTINNYFAECDFGEPSRPD